MVLVNLPKRVFQQMNRYTDTVKLISARLEELSHYDFCSYEKLLEAQKYSLTSGGKHLRGLILMQTAALGGVDADVSLDFACALEMVHTYSLIHDDLPEMDNDDIRRGKPTCHIKFGTDIALLAGDALLTKAFSVISKAKGSSLDAKLKCVEILADSSGEHGMLAGQAIDKISENISIDINLLEELQARKTGDMFVAAIKMGCILGNVDFETEKSLIEYMRHLGIAFQIKDDILDVTSSLNILGKPVGSDAASNKATFVTLLGLEEAQLQLENKLKLAKSSVLKIDEPFYTILADYFGSRTK